MDETAHGLGLEEDKRVWEYFWGTKREIKNTNL